MRFDHFVGQVQHRDNCRGNRMRYLNREARGISYPGTKKSPFPVGKDRYESS